MTALHFEWNSGNAEVDRYLDTMLFTNSTDHSQSTEIARTIVEAGLALELAAVFITPSNLDNADLASRDAYDTKTAEIESLVAEKQALLSCKF